MSALRHELHIGFFDGAVVLQAVAIANKKTLRCYPIEMYWNSSIKEAERNYRMAYIRKGTHLRKVFVQSFNHDCVDE